MQIIKTAVELKAILAQQVNKKIGFVPTMGALHAGHIALVQESKAQTDFTVCSIFVNPTQFNQPADFELYPITIEADTLLLETVHCDLLFLPTVTEIYPNGTTASKNYDLGALDKIIEGAYRPGHFQGVCMVVEQLLEIVNPHYLFMGQKDYQQCMVVKRLLQLNPLFASIQLITFPTVREASGLAMSSRNMRLTPAAKEQASELYESLLYLHYTLQPGNEAACLTKAIKNLTQNGFDKVDYITLANADTFEPIEHWDGKQPLVLLGAAFIEGVRLIDNLILLPN